MDNFKFNFLLQGQLGSLSIDNFFFLFKMLPCYEYFLVTLFLHLNCLNVQQKASYPLNFPTQFSCLLKTGQAASVSRDSTALHLSPAYSLLTVTQSPIQWITCFLPMSCQVFRPEAQVLQVQTCGKKNSPTITEVENI